MAGESPGCYGKHVREDNQAADSQTILIGQGDIEVIVKEWKDYDSAVEKVSVKIFKLEYGISFARVLSGGLISSLCIGASKRMVKQVPVVTLPESVARKSKQSGNWDDQHRRAVEGIGVAIELRNGIRNERPHPYDDHQNEGPQSPVSLEEFAGKEVFLRLCLLQGLCC